MTSLHVVGFESAKRGCDSPFLPFPKELATIIADYCAELKLREWIQPEAVYANPNIWENSNAVEAGVLDLTQMDQHIEEAAANPALIEFIKAKPDMYKKTYGIWKNPAALDWLLDDGIFEDPINEVEFPYLCSNPHPRAVKMVIVEIEQDDDMYEIDLAEFLANPSAFAYTTTNLAYLMSNDENDVGHWRMGNPAAVDSIRQDFKSNVWNRNGFKPLSRNPHPWAIEQLRLRWDEIHMDMFAANPGIFHYVTSKKLIKILSRPSH
jgi:hypothetical protein